MSSQSDAFYARCPPLYHFARYQVFAEVIALIKSSARCFYLILPVLHILSSIEGCLKVKKSIPPNILRFWQIKYLFIRLFHIHNSHNLTIHSHCNTVGHIRQMVLCLSTNSFLLTILNTCRYNAISAYFCIFALFSLYLAPVFHS